MTKASFIAPQLATLSDQVFSDPEWIFEEKFDGIRCIAVQSKGTLTLYSRNRKKLNESFAPIVKALEGKTKADFIADGELVAFDKGITSFSKLQQRDQKKVPLYLYLFDLLLWDGIDLRKQPLLQRKKQLKAHFPFNEKIRYTPHKQEQGEAAFKRASQKGWEGIIGKRADGLYQSKRTREWLKFKCVLGQELVIGGYTDPQGSRTGFGALLVGYYKGNKLHYAGKVGTGYDQHTLTTLGKTLRALTQERCPFDEPVKEKNVHFVTPRLVCEVGFTEWTKDGKLRHPRFLGLRTDKRAKEVKREKPS